MTKRLSAVFAQSHIHNLHRPDLLRSIQTGEADHLDVPAVVFVDGPNKNHLRFYREDLEAFARSFLNAPFIYDHNVAELDSRHGIVQSSVFEDNRIVQTLRLTTRKGMEDYLEGKIDRFSIGWHYDDAICSICKQSFFSPECSHFPGQEAGGQICDLYFVHPTGKETSAVISPAVEGTGLLSTLANQKEMFSVKSAVIGAHARAFSTHKGVHPMENQDPKETGAAPAAPQSAAALAQIEKNRQATASILGEQERLAALNAQLAQSESILIATCAHLLESALSTSALPDVTQARIRRAFEGKIFEAAELQTSIDEARAEISSLSAGAVVQGPGRVASMYNAEDQFRAALDDLLGAPRDAGKESLKAHALSGIREAYLLMTGDYGFTGSFQIESVLATTANFPAIVKDSMNKILAQAWAQYGEAGYDWWNKIVTVEHFTDLNEVDWLITGTIASLPEVSERGEYTPLVIGDNVETSAWTKYGGYVPLTLEAMLRDDTRAFRLFPREVALGGIRNISEQVAAVFTDNSGVGPTLADTGALFNATAVTTAGGHANLLTAALGADYTAWEAVAAAMYNQPMHVANTYDSTSYAGAGKKQAVDPKYFLGPRALRGQAQALFLPRWASVVDAVATAGGPSWAGAVEPITVPEWTDTADWAAVIDPKLIPGIMIGEIFGVMPQIFVAGSERDPAMFMNDESRIKVRQFLTVGVANWRALHKSNV